MTQANIFEAKTHLSRLIEKALKGEEVIIARHGKPLVRLEPVEKKRSRNRMMGCLEGKGWAAPDWDSPETNKEIENMFYKGREEGKDLYR